MHTHTATRATRKHTTIAAARSYNNCTHTAARQLEPVPGAGTCTQARSLVRLSVRATTIARIHTQAFADVDCDERCDVFLLPAAFSVSVTARLRFLANNSSNSAHSSAVFVVFVFVVLFVSKFHEVYPKRCFSIYLRLLGGYTVTNPIRVKRTRVGKQRTQRHWNLRCTRR